MNLLDLLINWKRLSISILFKKLVMVHFIGEMDCVFLIVTKKTLLSVSLHIINFML